MIHSRELNLGGLTLITSCGCNLKCDYCQIARSVNDFSPEIQRKTIKALKDGTFLENTLKVLHRLNQSPVKITRFSLWGQEPTLTLHHFTEHIEDWLNAFPNVKHIMFATNAIDYGDRIVDFFLAVDKYCKTERFEIEVQMSFDGEESTDNIRNADSRKIYNNIAHMYERLNEIHLKHVRPKFHYHGVVSKDLLYRLDSAEKIINYYHNLDDWSKSLTAKCLNPQVSIHPRVSLSLENPIDASTEDGIKLNSFYKISTKVKDVAYFDNNIDSASATLVNALQTFRQALKNKSIMQNLQDASLNPNYFRELNENLSELSYCGNAYGELKLMYDGTSVNCQNSIYETKSEYIKEDGSREVAIKKAQADNGYYINILTASDEEIRRYFELFRISKQSSFMWTFQSTATLMWWLFKAKQIDESYWDMNKLLEHAFILAWINCCYYNHYLKTGTMFCKHTGMIRFYCNGFMDAVVNYYTDQTAIKPIREEKENCPKC